jgi:diacylglycerol kinase (ATP)
MQTLPSDSSIVDVASPELCESKGKEKEVAVEGPTTTSGTTDLHGSRCGHKHLLHSRQSTLSMSSSQGKHRKPKGKQAKKAAKKEHKTAKLELKIDKLKGLLHQRQMTVIAFVNSRSGAQLGEMVMPHLAAILGEDHVFDIISDGIKPGLEQFKDAPNLRVLVGGGDGTYHYVIQAMIEAGICPLPPVGTIPLGTGNDLARQFGWGGSVYPNRKKVLKLVYKFATSACLTPLDIWMVKITPKDPETLEPLENESTSQIMFNYFNAGFEAGVSYRFDRFRKRHQKLFKARKVNQIGYGLSALSSTMRGGNQSLNNLVEMYVNGSKLETPEDLKTLVVLNFKNYQAGLDIWGKPKRAGVSAEPAIDDQIAEVVGLGGVRHELKVRSHIRKGYHLAQGSSIKINVFTDIPINYDGEPFIQRGPCEIHLEPWCMAYILTNPKVDLDVNISSASVPTRTPGAHRESSASAAEEVYR